MLSHSPPSCDSEEIIFERLLQAGGKDFIRVILLSQKWNTIIRAAVNFLCRGSKTSKKESIQCIWCFRGVRIRRRGCRSQWQGHTQTFLKSLRWTDSFVVRQNQIIPTLQRGNDCFDRFCLQIQKNSCGWILQRCARKSSTALNQFRDWSCGEYGHWILQIIAWSDRLSHWATSGGG